MFLLNNSGNPGLIPHLFLFVLLNLIRNYDLMISGNNIQFGTPSIPSK